jgi:hypothetical protein
MCILVAGDFNVALKANRLFKLNVKVAVWQV